MPNSKTDSSGFATQSADRERDNAAKGGAVTGPGNPDNKHRAVSPYSEDLQTQIAAKGGKKKDKSLEKQNRNHL